MIAIPTSVFYDDSRNSWVVEYGSPDRREHFGAEPRSEDRARDRAEAMGLRRVDQTLDSIAVDLSGAAYGPKDYE